MKSNRKVITLRTHEDIVNNIGKARFYINNGNSLFRLRSFHDRAELITARTTSQPGKNDVVIVSDIFDNKNRLVCRTKFIIYVDVGQYVFWILKNTKEINCSYLNYGIIIINYSITVHNQIPILKYRKQHQVRRIAPDLADPNKEIL